VAETNVERARSGYEAALHGDLDALRELLDPDVQWHGGDPSAPGACRNREQALAVMGRAFGAARLGELVDVRGAGDTVVVTLRRPSADREPAALVANLTTFRDGRVVEMVHYPRPQDALAAAGL
jgi:ketosteroid isomerase-like protein